MSNETALKEGQVSNAGIIHKIFRYVKYFLEFVGLLSLISQSPVIINYFLNEQPETPNLQGVAEPVISILDENTVSDAVISIDNNTQDQLYLQKIGVTNFGQSSLENLAIEYKFKVERNDDFHILASIYNTSPPGLIAIDSRGDAEDTRYNRIYSIKQLNPSEGISLLFLINKNRRIDNVTPRANDFDATKYWHFYYK
jgi:hypothetical protein